MAGNVVQLFVKGRYLATMNCVGAPVCFPRHVTVEGGSRPEYANQFTMVPTTTSNDYPLFVQKLRLEAAVSDVGYFRFCIKSNPDDIHGASLIVYYRISNPYYWDNTYKDADLELLMLLGDTYSGAELLGAVAHIVDNSRDASATRVGISVASHYDANSGTNVPVLSFLDDGVGMTFHRLKEMLSFRKVPLPAQNNATSMKFFGNSFKEAALSLGLNVLVITQTNESRSIGLLSQSLNQDNKEFVEIPLIGFWRAEEAMVVDESLHSKTSSKRNLNLLKDHTPFDEFSLGGLFEKFGNGSGTCILIWDFTKDGVTRKDALRWIDNDIVICSNSSSRPDSSLVSFLKFLYRESTLNISVQGLHVPNFSWENNLSRKETMDELVMVNQMQVTFGISETDYAENIYEVLIYWNGRLIEVSKKVRNTESGSSRGVIGAVEVSHFMNKQTILESKQQFLHGYAYDQLEESLERVFNNYSARNLTPEDMNHTETSSNDHQWAQCDMCKKWRRLHPSVDSRYLPRDWFCHNFPYLGSCEDEQEKEEDGEITTHIDDPR